jgi:protein TonB
VNNLSAQDTQQKMKPAEEQKAVTQEKPIDKEVFTVVETMPAYPGGEKALYKFMRENVKYPEEAKLKNIQGRVFVSFIVETDGSVSNVQVLRGIGGGCDEEGVRVVSSMPKWTPGKQRGKAVRVQYNLPIKFALESKTEKKEGQEKQ